MEYWGMHVTKTLEYGTSHLLAFTLDIANSQIIGWSLRPFGGLILPLLESICVMLGCFCSCSVAKECLTLCNPMDCSTPDFPVLHYLQEFAQTHVHWVLSLKLIWLKSQALFHLHFQWLKSLLCLFSFPSVPFFWMHWYLPEYICNSVFNQWFEKNLNKYLVGPPAGNLLQDFLLEFLTDFIALNSASSRLPFPCCSDSGALSGTSDTEVNLILCAFTLSKAKCPSVSVYFLVFYHTIILFLLNILIFPL